MAAATPNPPALFNDVWVGYREEGDDDGVGTSNSSSSLSDGMILTIRLVALFRAAEAQRRVWMHAVRSDDGGGNEDDNDGDSDYDDDDDAASSSSSSSSSADSMDSRRPRHFVTSAADDGDAATLPTLSSRRSRRRRCRRRRHLMDYSAWNRLCYDLAQLSGRSGAEYYSDDWDYGWDDAPDDPSSDSSSGSSDYTSDDDDVEFEYIEEEVGAIDNDDGIPTYEIESIDDLAEASAAAFATSARRELRFVTIDDSPLPNSRHGDDVAANAAALPRIPHRHRGHNPATRRIAHHTVLAYRLGFYTSSRRAAQSSNIDQHVCRTWYRRPAGEWLWQFLRQRRQEAAAAAAGSAGVAEPQQRVSGGSSSSNAAAAEARQTVTSSLDALRADSSPQPAAASPPGLEVPPASADVSNRITAAQQVERMAERLRSLRRVTAVAATATAAAGTAPTSAAPRASTSESARARPGMQYLERLRELDGLNDNDASARSGRSATPSPAAAEAPSLTPQETETERDTFSFPTASGHWLNQYEPWTVFPWYGRWQEDDGEGGEAEAGETAPAASTPRQRNHPLPRADAGGVGANPDPNGDGVRSDWYRGVRGRMFDAVNAASAAANRDADRLAREDPNGERFYSHVVGGDEEVRLRPRQQQNLNRNRNRNALVVAGGDGGSGGGDGGVAQGWTLHRPRPNASASRPSPSTPAAASTSRAQPPAHYQRAGQGGEAVNELLSPRTDADGDEDPIATFASSRFRASPLSMDRDEGRTVTGSNGSSDNGSISNSDSIGIFPPLASAAASGTATSTPLSPPPMDPLDDRTHSASPTGYLEEVRSIEAAWRNLNQDDLGRYPPASLLSSPQPWPNGGTRDGVVATAADAVSAARTEAATSPTSSSSASTMPSWSSPSSSSLVRRRTLRDSAPHLRAPRGMRSGGSRNINSNGSSSNVVDSAQSTANAQAASPPSPPSHITERDDLRSIVESAQATMAQWIPPTWNPRGEDHPSSAESANRSSRDRSTRHRPASSSSRVDSALITPVSFDDHGGEDGGGNGNDALVLQQAHRHAPLISRADASHLGPRGFAILSAIDVDGNVSGRYEQSMAEDGVAPPRTWAPAQPALADRTFETVYALRFEVVGLRSPANVRNVLRNDESSVRFDAADGTNVSMRFLAALPAPSASTARATWTARRGDDSSRPLGYLSPADRRSEEDRAWTQARRNVTSSSRLGSGWNSDSMRAALGMPPRAAAPAESNTMVTARATLPGRSITATSTSALDAALSASMQHFGPLSPGEVGVLDRFLGAASSPQRTRDDSRRENSAESIAEAFIRDRQETLRAISELQERNRRAREALAVREAAGRGGHDNSGGGGDDDEDADADSDGTDATIRGADADATPQEPLPVSIGQRDMIRAIDAALTSDPCGRTPRSILADMPADAREELLASRAEKLRQREWWSSGMREYRRKQLEPQQPLSPMDTLDVVGPAFTLHSVTIKLKVGGASGGGLAGRRPISLRCLVFLDELDCTRRWPNGSVHVDDSTAVASEVLTFTSGEFTTTIGVGDAWGESTSYREMYEPQGLGQQQQEEGDEEDEDDDDGAEDASSSSSSSASSPRSMYASASSSLPLSSSDPSESLASATPRGPSGRFLTVKLSPVASDEGGGGGAAAPLQRGRREVQLLHVAAKGWPASAVTWSVPAQQWR